MHVRKWECEMARGNQTSGRAERSESPPSQRGMPKCAVTREIGANGILHMTAKYETTGREQKIRIEASSGLSENDIQKMVKDAESHAEEDKNRREEIDTRNRLDSLTYEVEKNAKEWSDKLSAELKTKLETAVERARKALRADDLSEIRSAQEELSRVYSEAGQSLYAQGEQDVGTTATDEAATASAQANPKGSDNVVDADYEIVDEEKK